MASEILNHRKHGQIGNYIVETWEENKYIFPKLKNGQSIRVALPRTYCRLRHVTNVGGSFEFKKYLHQKRWYWADNRDGKSCQFIHIVREIARLLFKGDQEQSRTFLETHNMGVTL